MGGAGTDGFDPEAGFDFLGPALPEDFADEEGAAPIGGAGVAGAGLRGGRLVLVDAEGGGFPALPARPNDGRSSIPEAMDFAEPRVADETRETLDCPDVDRDRPIGAPGASGAMSS